MDEREPIIFNSELCKRCADIYCSMFSRKVTECQDFIPMTNADRIRAMTVEELATLIANSCPPKIYTACRYFGDGTHGCKDCWLNWLQEEAGEQ